MLKTLSRLGLLVGTAAVAALGFTGPAAAAPAAPVTPDSGSTALVTPDKKWKPAPRTDATTQVNLNGACEAFEFCLYINNGLQGPVADFQTADANYADNIFSPVLGSPVAVANNARSASNNDPFFFVVGCIDVNFTGMCGVAPPIAGGDLFPDFFLNLESHYFTF
jgi:hypothetical protein